MTPRQTKAFDIRDAALALIKTVKNQTAYEPSILSIWTHNSAYLYEHPFMETAIPPQIYLIN